MGNIRRQVLAGLLSCWSLGAMIHEVLVPEGGEGGVVAIDATGHIAMVFNAEGVYRTSIYPYGNKILGIFKNLLAD